MKILLPPSEGKSQSPARGSTLKLSTLSLPELTQAREELIKALVTLCQGPRARAISTLGLTPGLAGEVEKNAQLRTTPTMLAGRLYNGVLYEALSLSSLSPAAQSRAEKSLVIFSALFGAVHINDRIPPYRLSPTTKLPTFGTLAAHWKLPLAAAMETEVDGEVVMDLRSGPYAALWKPTGAVAKTTVAVRVLHESSGGKRTVVSHFNKATKGRIVASVLKQRANPTSVEALATLLATAGWDVESDDSGLKLDVIVQEL